jgi:hypothetical protein
MTHRPALGIVACVIMVSAGVQSSQADGIIGLKMQYGQGPPRIQQVVPGSPAEEAGLVAGDVIINIDGKRIATADEFFALMKGKQAGDVIRVYVHVQDVDRGFDIKLANQGTTFRPFQLSEAESEAVAELRDVYAKTETDPRVWGHRIVAAEIAWDRINVRTIKYLRGLTALRSLTIITVSDDADLDLTWLAPLEEIKTLTELRLVGPGITDDFVAACGPLTNVRTIKLIETQISDAAAKRLVECHSLWTTLSFRASPVTDATLEPLKGCQDLEVLDLFSTQVTGSGLAHLEGLKRLRDLDLDRSALTADNVVHLAPLTSLEGLDLSNTAVTDAELKHLAGLTKLMFLGLNNTGQVAAAPPRRGGIGGGLIPAIEAEMQGTGTGGADKRERGVTCQGVMDALSDLKNLRDLEILGPECIPGERRDMAKIWPQATIQTSNGTVTPTR